jgi:hypothetical protein
MMNNNIKKRGNKATNKKDIGKTQERPQDESQEFNNKELHLLSIRNKVVVDNT